MSEGGFDQKLNIASTVDDVSDQPIEHEDRSKLHCKLLVTVHQRLTELKLWKPRSVRLVKKTWGKLAWNSEEEATVGVKILAGGLTHNPGQMHLSSHTI